MKRPPVLLALERLRTALEAVAAALSSPDEPALMAAEAGLASALAEVAAIRTVRPAERLSLAREVAQARAALMRCRILGAAALDTVHATLVSQGRAPGYDRAAMPQRVVLTGTEVKARL